MNSTTRNRRLYERAATVLPNIHLDQRHADALERLLAETGETRAALIRRLILSEEGRLRNRPGFPASAFG